MADKKPKILDDPFAQTTPAAPLPAARIGTSKAGRKRKRVYQPEDVAPIGVGLTFAEGEELNEIARELGINRHELLVWWIRQFMDRWRAGWRPETETKTVLKK